MTNTIFEKLRDAIHAIRPQANYQYVMMRFLLGKETATRSEIAEELERWNADKPEGFDFRTVPVFDTKLVGTLIEQTGDFFTLSDHAELNFYERHQLISICAEKITGYLPGGGTIPYSASEFSPLTDEQEIKEAHDKVVSALTAASTKEKEFKAYKMTGKGYWLDEHGIFFYTADPTTITENQFWDVFGTREPSWDREGLVMSEGNKDWILEINSPKEGLSNAHGQFLKDQNGRIYYTHKGVVNVRKSRDGYRFDDIYAGLGIKSGSGHPLPKKGPDQIIISDLESPDFVENVADYVQEVQEFRDFVETQEYQDLGEEEPTEYWMIRAGRDGFDWENQRDRKIAAIHYYSFDLSKCTESDGTLSKEKVKENVYKIRKDRGDDEPTPQKWGAVYEQLENIFNVNRKGGKCRILVIGSNKELLGIGDATSQYEYKEGLPNPHAINVEWIETASEGAVKKLPESCWFMQRSIKELTREQYDLIMSQSNAGGGSSGGNQDDPCEQWKKYTDPDGILERKKNVIFYGPPGTGKTWTATQVAECFTGCTVSDCPDTFRVTFHPSYSYEDFIEGYRPRADDDAAFSKTEYAVDPAWFQNLMATAGSSKTPGPIPFADFATAISPQRSVASPYKLMDGIFKEAVEHAKNQEEGGRTVLFIDEINRGNIPKIFGELITLIEKDKREEKYYARLTYSRDKFWVPPNLYIIGTMNTADTSLIQVDSALRRRFGWIELMPEEKDSQGNELVSADYKDIMTSINDKIRDEFMLRDKQIGHSYYMDIENKKKFKQVFLEDIVPLLQDYFYHNYNDLEKILGKGVIDAEKQNVKVDLLEKDGDDFYDAVKKSVKSAGSESDSDDE